ncbi:hypothetical protein AA313_de0204379 [Arthrobotrys entomopaga]|nr:hypothetical protein AA313_de0204379 [Arthrobotrys entomopaga]
MADQILTIDLTVRAADVDFNKAREYLYDKRTTSFMGALAFQEVDYAPIDRTLRKIVDLVNTRLNGANTKEKDYIPDGEVPSPGGAIVQPRGSYGSRTALRGHVDLDLDLVFPYNYKIVAEGKKEGELIKRTISQVLGCDEPFAANSADLDGHDLSGNLVVTKDGLRLVMLYIWGRLVDKNDYILPNKFTTTPLQIDDHYPIDVRPGISPAIRIHQDKTLATLTRSISAQITDTPGYNPNIQGQTALDLDFFIKVVTKRFGGEEVLVGVDKNGPLGDRQYQTTTFIPSGKEWINSNRLLPIDRVALMTLKWWKNSFATDTTFPIKFEIRDPSKAPSYRNGLPGDVKLKSHHFLAALNALHELPATNPLHVPNYSYLPFSLVHVMNVMIKVLTFINQSYQPASRFHIAYSHNWSPEIAENERTVVFPFPQISCGVCETLYKQISSDIVGYDAIIKSKVIPTFIEGLQKALDTLRDQDSKLIPGAYTFEELS